MTKRAQPHTLRPTPASARAALLLALLVSPLAGCATWFGGESDKSEEASAEAKPQEAALQAALAKIDARLVRIDERLEGFEKASHSARRDATQFQHELQELRSQMRSVRKLVELDARKTRSGLSVDLDPEAGKRVADAEHRLSESARVPLPPALEGDTESLVETPLADNASPARLTDEAEEKMRLARYGEAVVILTDVQTKFPQSDDGGRSLLLLADGWLKIGEPQNALPAVRQIYTRFPTSFRIPAAKLLEARAQEKLGARQKALALYRELLATQAEGRQGQEARAALTRLRDEP